MPKPKKTARAGFAVVADVHMANHARWGGAVEDGLNTRGRMILSSLHEAVAVADVAGCSHLVVAGDLFDNRRPEPAVIAAVQDVFWKARERGVEVVVLPGNHDLLDVDACGGNTTCAPLWQSARVVDDAGWWRVDDVAVLMVPFQSRVPMAMHLSEQLQRSQVPAEFAPGTKRVLVTHVGVYDGATATPWQRRAKDAIEADFFLGLLEDVGIDTAFVGNYHEHSVWTGKSRIVQVGTLCPASFSDAGYDGRGLVAVYQHGGFRFVEVPGPRFVDVTGPAFVDGLEMSSPALLARTFVRVAWGVSLPVDLEQALGGVEGAPDPSSPGASDDGESGEQVDPRVALAAFVDGMELPEDVDRAAVAALVDDCWTKGA